MSKPTRQCVECATVFEWTGIGRPPNRCDTCKKEQKSRARDVADEEPAKPRAARKKTAKKVRIARVATEARTNGNGRGKSSVKRILAELRGELADLQEREAHLQDAIDAMERLT